MEPTGHSNQRILFLVKISLTQAPEVPMVIPLKALVSLFVFPPARCRTLAPPNHSSISLFPFSFLFFFFLSPDFLPAGVLFLFLLLVSTSFFSCKESAGVRGEKPCGLFLLVFFSGTVFVH